MQAAAFASAGEAADMLDASLDHLAATDWPTLGTAAHAEMLVRLSCAQTKLTAVNAAVLASFTAGNGYEPDGHRSVTELEADIGRWISEWNKNPRPFIWTKTADEILETLAAYCQRIS